VRSVAAVLVALAMLVLTGCGSTSDGPVITGVSRSDNGGFHGTLLDKPYVVPHVPLTDSSRQPFDLATDDHAVDVVFFGYTHCPDVCQVVMGTIASAYVRLDKAQQHDVRVIFVTTDPKRDTAAVLKTYLARFHPDFLGLTGQLDSIDRLGKPLGIFIKKGQKLSSGGYEVNHTTSVLAVENGRARLVWTGGTSPSDMAADITRLLKS
jgi:protein SCO1